MTIASSLATMLAHAVFLCCILGLIALVVLRNKTRVAMASSFAVAPLSPQTIDRRVHPIALIIPALNEAAVLPATVSNIFSASTLSNQLGCPGPTVMIVDAGRDDAKDRLDRLLSSHPTLHLLAYPSSPSRGAQQNFGVQHSAAAFSPSAPILLFLHADTRLPTGWDTAILSALSSNRPPAIGAFSLSLTNPIPAPLRLMLKGANIRACYGGLPYGDQGYFLCRRTFDATGGFPDVPIMEDVELLWRIRQQVKGGKVAILNAPVTTSPRRWIKKGVLWNTILNQLLMFAWLCGVHPEKIYEWYYGRLPSDRGSENDL